MSLSDLQKFQRRLALTDYFRHVFGVEDVTDRDSISDFYDKVKPTKKDPYDVEGRSHVANALRSLVVGIEPDDLRRYDRNVKTHTERVNRGRTEPIKLKYFQILAALITEHYLDRFTSDRSAFLDNLNAFVGRQREIRGGYRYLPLFEWDDLNKLAFWMATGSGKTLVMHLNYYQYLHYAKDHRDMQPDNILLVTPNEGLSDQHISEMKKSGIPCYHFNAETPTLYRGDSWSVKVIEIHKLVEQKTGGGKSVDVSHLEGRNLVFVDEGHKGAGGEAWMGRRAAIAEDGFTFEYSATFGQGIGGESADLQEAYGKAILFYYSYARFYEDGYGKEYRILNLKRDLYQDLTDRYMLANLLAFYEQVRYYTHHVDLLYSTYNIRPPLLAFVGHTVTGGKTLADVRRSVTHRESFTDVQRLVDFLDRVLRNEGNWVPQTIDAILTGDTGLRRADGSDLFGEHFGTLRKAKLDGAAIYSDMCQRVFRASATGTGLQLVDLKSLDGEIGLRATANSPMFGLINIGSDASFLQLAEEEMPEISVQVERFRGSLFKSINEQGSTINILIGAKKFIEGWDSWRVSTMGLMNIGRGEGPQIIQLFGRGVRLLGKGRTLKRSTELDDDPPEDITVVETLNIFGVRAEYMAQFRDHLKKAGIDPGEWETVTIPTRPGPDFAHEGLLLIRPDIRTQFEDAVGILLQTVDLKPTVDLTQRAQEWVSSGLRSEFAEVSEQLEPCTLPSEVLALFNWERLYRDTWRFCVSRRYRNLALDRSALQRVLEEERYKLVCPPDMLRVESFEDVKRLEHIGLMILRRYVERYYGREHRRWVDKRLGYQTLKDDDENLIQFYKAKVKRSADDVLQTLKEMLEDPRLYEESGDLPRRVHFGRHLYHPLLVKHAGEIVKYFPSGLNDGEMRFVEKLRAFVRTPEGEELLARRDRELFLLRNQSRGRGIGFLPSDDGFYPDFILWLKGSAQQDIVFIEPHGLLRDIQPKDNPKVQFHKGVKDYQRMLNKRAGRGDVILHSYLISQTSYEELSKHFATESKDVLNSWHVYFPDQGYAAAILEEVLAGGN